jgi:hypothetical protein
MTSEEFKRLSPGEQAAELRVVTGAMLSITDKSLDPAAAIEQILQGAIDSGRATISDVLIATDLLTDTRPSVPF